jgi:hypothetical protein
MGSMAKAVPPGSRKGLTHNAQTLAAKKILFIFFPPKMISHTQIEIPISTGRISRSKGKVSKMPPNSTMVKDLSVKGVKKT